MDLIVSPSATGNGAHTGIALLGDETVRCALGRTGVTTQKAEGDGATPVGAWAMERVLYRADRLAAPRTGLPLAVIGRDEGWCDDPADPSYNQPVHLPHAGRAEKLWRQDHLYDVLVILDYNRNPVIAGQGSAIFLHLARPDLGPTEGCVAMALPHLLAVLETAGPGSRVCVQIAD